MISRYAMLSRYECVLTRKPKIDTIRTRVSDVSLLRPAISIAWKVGGVFSEHFFRSNTTKYL